MQKKKKKGEFEDVGFPDEACSMPPVNVVSDEEGTVIR